MSTPGNVPPTLGNNVPKPPRSRGNLLTGVGLLAAIGVGAMYLIYKEDQHVIKEHAKHGGDPRGVDPTKKPGT